MVRFVVRRLAGILLTLWAAVTLVFLAIYIVPGDPAEAALSQSTASQDVIEQRREALGLDAPIYVQYVRYLSGLVRADLGVSWSAGQPVSLMIGQQIGPTARLALASMVVAVVAGVALGVAASLGEGRWLGAVCHGLTGLLLSVPVMFSGTVAIWIGAVVLGILPATGQGTLAQLVMPALVVGLNVAAGISRTVEAGIGQVRHEPFVLLAKAKGLNAWQTGIRHALRVGMLPTLDVVALQFGFLLGGAVVTEIVFARQGLGRLLLFAVLDKDLPVVQGIVVLSAVVYGVLNLLADIGKAWLDPRIRQETL
ncbi:MAG TPA: ABC transporter permease [Aggregatilineales bacterium]|nr:ABC transporter permease [Aggregatilineales bacterium]